jgi:hypothetical protein
MTHVRHSIAVMSLGVALFGSPVAAQRQDTIVRNAGAAQHPGTATLTMEVSIGAVSGPDAYTLGDVSEIAVGRDGSIYVLDRGAYVVRVYDAAGRHVRDLGRRGEGPGDLASPAGLGVLPDGRVLVWDTRLKWITAFDASGSGVATWPVHTTGAVGGTHGLVLDSAGFAFARMVQVLSRPVVQFGPAESRVTWFRFRTRDGALVDSTVEPALPPFAVPPLRASTPREMRQMAMPFVPRRIATFSPLGYFVSGLAERYAFDVHVPGGAIVSVRRNVAPTPVPARARDSVRADIEEKMRAVDSRWTWPAAEVPRLMPYFVEMFVGLDGRIWLQRDKSQPPLSSAPPQPGRAGASGAGQPDPNVAFTYLPTHFDVFEPTGTFIGSVEMPPKVTPMAMRGDQVWGVAKDDDDVQFVRRYRIVWK